MDFATLERRAWTDPAVAQSYAARFPAVTVGAVPALLEAAQVVPGMQILDIASGPAPAAREARAWGARPILFDFSEGMLRLATAAVPGADRVRGSALSIPLRAESVDATVCNFGLLHFPDPDRALAEAARVLRGGGSAGWSVWSEDSVALRLIPRTMDRLGYRPQLPPGPDFFQYGSPERMAAGLLRAGLRPRPATTIAWTARFGSADEYWKAFFDGTARTRASMHALLGPDQERLRNAVDEELIQYRGEDGSIAIPTGAVIGAGTRPR